jgi:hypothetical protein
MDLAPLIELEAAAADHLGKAVSAFMGGRYSEMYDHARRACRLRETPAALRLLACAALLDRRYSIAASLWRRLAGSEPDSAARSSESRF